MGRRTTTVAEAAEILGIGKGTAYRAVESGEIPSIRIGRRLLIPTIALLNLLDGNQEESGVTYAGDAAPDPTDDVAPVTPDPT